MSVLPNQPSSRLDFRISPEHKALIERAASAQGQTVSNFAIASLLKAAEEAIHRARWPEVPRDARRRRHAECRAPRRRRAPHDSG